jgi:hypothetical protein
MKLQLQCTHYGERFMDDDETMHVILKAASGHHFHDNDEKVN